VITVSPAEIGPHVAVGKVRVLVALADKGLPPGQASYFKTLLASVDLKK
jgi:hypothetical protein